MEPCANEVSGLLKGGNLFLFQGSGTNPLFPGFGTHTHHCSISHRSCETQMPTPSLPSPADHPDPPGKEQGCLGVSGRFCPVTAPEHGVQQNKSPLVSRPWPGPTKGLGDAPAPSMGTGEPMVGTSPEWLWKQHSTQGVLVKRDNKELLWLFHRVFHQRKPARLKE